MFSDFLRRLGQAGPQRLPDPDGRLALAALLVRVARTDHDYSQPERDRIDRALRTRFGLSPFETARLRREAEELEADAPDTVRFTRAIKEAVPLAERVAVLEAMWEVALADGGRGHDESTTLRLVADLLGVSDLESGLARQRVEARRD